MKTIWAFSLTMSLILLAAFPSMAKEISKTEKALWMAVEDANQSAVQKLIKAKVNINAQDEHGESALIKAIANDNDSIAGLLLKNRADVNLKDEAGNTALFYAVSNNNEKLSRDVINAHADLKLVYGEKKESVLFEAARSNAAAVAKLLLQKEPKLAGMLNSEGQNALFASVELGNVEVTKVLAQKLDPNLKDKSGKTPKDIAKASGLKKTLNALSSVSP